MRGKSKIVYEIVLTLVLAIYGTCVFAADSAIPSISVSPPLDTTATDVASPAIPTSPETNVTHPNLVTPQNSTPVPGVQKDNSPPTKPKDTTMGEMFKFPSNPAQLSTGDNQLGQQIATDEKNAQMVPIWQAAHDEKVQEHREQTRASQQKEFAAQMAELNARYQYLLREAANKGVELPTAPDWGQGADTRPPQFGSPGLQRLVSPTVPPPALEYRPDASAKTGDYPEHANLEWMQSVINGMTQEERDVCTTVHKLSVGLMQSSTVASPPPQSPPYPDHNANYGATYGNTYGYGKPPAYGANPNYFNSSPYERQNQSHGYNYGYDNPNYNYGQGLRQPNSNWQGGGWYGNQ